MDNIVGTPVVSSASDFDGAMFKLFDVVTTKDKPWGAAPNPALPWAATKRKAARGCQQLGGTHNFNPHLKKSKAAISPSGKMNALRIGQHHQSISK